MSRGQKEVGEELCGTLGQGIPSRGTSKCKGPEAEWVGPREDQDEAGVERMRMVDRGEVREGTGRLEALSPKG